MAVYRSAGAVRRQLCLSRIITRSGSLWMSVRDECALNRTTRRSGCAQPQAASREDLARRTPIAALHATSDSLRSPAGRAPESWLLVVEVCVGSRDQPLARRGVVGGQLAGLLQAVDVGLHAARGRLAGERRHETSLLDVQAVRGMQAYVDGLQQ